MQIECKSNTNPIALDLQWALDLQRIRIGLAFDLQWICIGFALDLQVACI